MLVKITDTKGRDYWINPIYVRAVTPGKGRGSEVRVGFSVGLGGSVIKTDAPPEDVARAIDEAMPDSAAGYYAAAVDQQAEDDEATRQAAMGGMTGGVI